MKRRKGRPIMLLLHQARLLFKKQRVTASINDTVMPGNFKYCFRKTFWAWIKAIHSKTDLGPTRKAPENSYHHDYKA